MVTDSMRLSLRFSGGGTRQLGSWKPESILGGEGRTLLSWGSWLILWLAARVGDCLSSVSFRRSRSPLCHYFRAPCPLTVAVALCPSYSNDRKNQGPAPPIKLLTAALGLIFPSFARRPFAILSVNEVNKEGAWVTQLKCKKRESCCQEGNEPQVQHKVLLVL